MNDMIAYYHHAHYMHVHSCYQDLYDILLRVDFLDYMTMMKKYPMSHQWLLTQRISFLIQRLRYFIYDHDLELIEAVHETTWKTFDALKELDADEEMLKDYRWMLEKLELSRNKMRR